VLQSRSHQEPAYFGGAGATKSPLILVEPEPPRARLFWWSRSHQEPAYFGGAGATKSRSNAKNRSYEKNIKIGFLFEYDFFSCPLFFYNGSAMVMEEASYPLVV
jgi:hypothetical protein